MSAVLLATQRCGVCSAPSLLNLAAIAHRWLTTQAVDVATASASHQQVLSPATHAAAAAGEVPQPSTSGRELEPKQQVLPSWLPITSSQAPPTFPAMEALQSVKDNARARFVETVEAHVRLRVDPRRGDQMVRGATRLPVNVGRPLRICVFAEGRVADDARVAGADIIGSAALADQLLEDKGKSIDFDRCIATPDMMKYLVKLGRILGPKGLMPNPKMGTLTEDVAAAVQEMRRGRLEFKMDRTGNVHVGLGKVDMPLQHLYWNLGAFMNGLMAVKPEGIKGGLKKYIKGVTVCSSMGRGVRIKLDTLTDAMAAAEAAVEGRAGDTAGAESQQSKA